MILKVYLGWWVLGIWDFEGGIRGLDVVGVRIGRLGVIAIEGLAGLG